MGKASTGSLNGVIDHILSPLAVPVEGILDGMLNLLREHSRKLAVLLILTQDTLGLFVYSATTLPNLKEWTQLRPLFLGLLA